MKGKVLSGIEFLKKVNEGDRSLPGRRIAVVGGGNAAVDVARTIVRLGGKPVVIYRRTQKEMPAFKDEIARAREEGVLFRFLVLPTRAEQSLDKTRLTCVRMKPGPVDESGRRTPLPKEGSEFTVAFDAVISAIGEDPDLEVLPARTRKHLVEGTRGYRLEDNLYIAGDFKNGSSTVIEAVTSGREAARMIDSRITGAGLALQTASPGPEFASACYEPSPRVMVREAAVGMRVKNLEIEERSGITAAEAEKEARRCFHCGCAAVSPSDIGAALVAMDGTIVTTKRRIDAGAFFAPHAMTPTVLDPDEMITEIRVPKMAEGARQQYLKFTLRKPVDFAIVSVASVITEKDGKCTDVRIALGAVAPAPIRARGAEARLRGRQITDRLAAEAAEAAVDGVKPLGENAYKVQITRALVKRAILGEQE